MTLPLYIAAALAYLACALLLYGLFVYLDARANISSLPTTEALVASVFWPITLILFVALVLFVAPFSRVARLAQRLGEKHREGSR